MDSLMFIKCSYHYLCKKEKVGDLINYWAKKLKTKAFFIDCDPFKCIIDCYGRITDILLQHCHFTSSEDDSIKVQVNSYVTICRKEKEYFALNEGFRNAYVDTCETGVGEKILYELANVVGLNNFSWDKDYYARNIKKKVGNS